MGAPQSASDSVAIGSVLLLLGGISTGCFPLPMKFARKWAWENIWFVYSVVGLLAVPLIVALWTVPHLASVYRAASLRTLFFTLLFGFAWGVGNVLFGEAVSMVGIALTFAIVGGLGSAVGSLIPLIVLRSNRLTQSPGLVIMLGVLMTVLGVAMLGTAGRRREKHLRLQVHSGSVVLGISLCIVAGVLGSMLNFSFAFGSSVANEAVRRGATAGSGSNAVWVIAFLGGFISNGGYAFIKLARNKTWRRFSAKSASPSGLLSASMGVLFCAGFLLYGKGATLLGVMGPVVGWPVFQATTIMVSTASGAAFGEWRGADRRFIVLNLAGLSVLIAAIVVLSVGNRL